MYFRHKELKDTNGNFRLQGLRKRGSGAKRVDRPNMYFPFFYNVKDKKLSLKRISSEDIEIFPYLSNGTEGRWRWGKETSEKRLDELTVKLIKRRNEYDVFQKDYLNKDGETKRVKPKSLWLGSEFSSEAGTLQVKKIFGKSIFSTPKSYEFIEFCLQQVVDKNSIILDSFAGSGTTAHSVLKLNEEDGGNRKFILVETMEYAETITAERVRRVMKGYGKDNKAVAGLGGGFDYYEIGDVIFDGEGNLNEAIGIEEIRKYVAFTENIPAENQVSIDNELSPYLLGKVDETAYFFIYEKDNITTLNLDFLASLNFKPEASVIYADNCLLSKEIMQKYNIIFKKIPRDITRF